MGIRRNRQLDPQNCGWEGERPVGTWSLGPLKISVLEPQRQDPKQLEVITSRMLSNDAVATEGLVARLGMLLNVMPEEHGGRRPCRPLKRPHHHLLLPPHLHHLQLPPDDRSPLSGTSSPGR